MKFSQMSTEQAVAAIVRVTDPISNISTDEEFHNAMLACANDLKQSHNAITRYAAVASKLVPVLLGKHKADFYAIVAAMTEKSVEAVSKQLAVVTIKDFVEFFDEDFTALFSSSVKQETTI